MHYRYDNVITLRTFSKIHGLAGVRVGYGFAHDHLIGNLNKIKLPFEPSSLAQAAGIAALGDREFVLRSLEVNARGVRYLTDALRELGLSPVPSEANFVFVPMESESQAKQVFEGLLEQGVIVRHTASFGLPQGLRITAGTEEENRELIRCLKPVLQPIAA
jgi:histidinol-phosphate aminotransferase